MFDKNEIKNNLTIEQIEEYITSLGGEPIRTDKGLICKTICHHSKDELCEASHKLYYYPNSHLFKCYTGCADSTFDIFELTEKIYKRENPSFTFTSAINRVANYFGIEGANFSEEDFQLTDWKIFDKMKKEEEAYKQKVELKYYDKSILRNLPRPIIEPWLKEGINTRAQKLANIRFDPITDSIIIPHYDINGNLIGIRRRTLIEEEEKYGKYLPAILNGDMYNHPLSFNLYHLNLSKNNIHDSKMAVVFESEKSTLQYMSYFGTENDISVACCGSNLIKYQVSLLTSLGAKEIVVAFDKQWQEKGDEEFKRWTKKLTEIHNKYHNEVTISFIFDKESKYLGYKDSPTDKGKEVFLNLFKERIYL